MQTHFVRTRRTWLAYLALAYYSCLLNGLGPVMPFLRSDLHLSYAETSLHTSAFALGMVAAGLLGDRVIRGQGRRGAFLIGLGGLAGGSLLLVVARSFAFSLAGAFLMGALGTLLLVLEPAILADEHGEARAVALNEANMLASACALIVPLVVGALAPTILGWRTAYLLSTLFLVLITWQLRGLTLPSFPVSTAAEPSTGPLPPAYWAYWLLLVCCVSLEFSMIFWAADFLHIVARVPKDAAAALVSVFFAAMAIGRFAASRLARNLPADRLLVPALTVTAAGFPFFWLAPSTPMRVCGLFLTGIGIASLYPVVLSLAIGTAPARSAAASARATLASATAIGVAPLVLAGLADHVGISHAYGTVIVLLLLALITSRVARHLAGTQARATLSTGVDI
jgi:MFS family permease